MKGKVLSAILLFSVGCGQQVRTASNPSRNTAAGIVNGTDVTGSDEYSKHVVFLQLKMGEGAAICTGSILDDQTVLTAGHCLAGATAGAIAFADNLRSGRPSPDLVRQIDKIAVYPKFKAPKEGNDDGDSDQVPPQPDQIPSVEDMQGALDQMGQVDYDIAIVHFTGGLPAGYEPVTLASDESILQPGATLQMIGYGLAKVNPVDKTIGGKVVKVPVPDQTTAGQLRETSLPIASVDTQIGMIFTDSTKTGVCSGDSGGPGFMKDSSGNIVQVGIAEAVGTAYCNSVSMHTSIFPFLKWIQQTQQRLEKQQLLSAAGV